MRGIDTCAPLNAGAARKIRELGFDFVGRYLVPRWYPKALLRAEAEALSEAGLYILSCWETSADRVKSGAEAGAKDGESAASLAEKIGQPPGTIIYFAVDYDAGERDFRKIAAYLTAARAQLRPKYEVGVYGSARVCDAMHTLVPQCKGYWQCCAWSYGHISDAATVYQAHWQEDPSARVVGKQLGFEVDLDECDDMVRAGMWTLKEDRMTDQEVYEAVQRHANTLPVPEWAKDELLEAQELGITDGTRPMTLMPRYQAAIMCKRAVHAALSMKEPEDYKRFSGLLDDD